MKWLAALLAALCFGSPASAAIALTNLGVAGPTAGPQSLTPASNVPSGSLIVVAWLDASANGLCGTVTDSVSNTYVVAVRQPTMALDEGLCIFYAANATALTTAGTITVTPNVGGSDTWLSAMYATGVATSSPKDAVATSFGAPSTSPSVTVTPGQANELIVGVAYSEGGNPSWAQAVGWTNNPGTSGGSALWCLLSSFNFCLSGSLITASTSAQTWSPTLVSSATWSAAAATFKPAIVGASHNLILLGVGH